MTFEARWITSTPASGLHAAALLLAGVAPADRQVADALAAEVAGLSDDLQTIGLAREPFFEHAIPLSARFDSPVELAGVVLTKVLGPRPATGATQRLARRLLSLFGAMQAARGELLAELELRSGPLREQWEARGAGLLAAARRLTADDVIVEAADVILVQPIGGGGGTAHPLYNAICFEALLANPLSELPEVVRLGWLWAQLHLDLPRYEEQVGRAALARVGPLAVLPALLSAAEEVELARFDRRLVETALGAWDAGPLDAEALWGWWETYHASDTRWEVALAALVQMVGEEAPGT